MLALKVFLASFLYGGIIEIAQGLFTTTRSADVQDLLTNIAGAIIAILVLRFLKYSI